MSLDEQELLQKQLNRPGRSSQSNSQRTSNQLDSSYSKHLSLRYAAPIMVNLEYSTGSHDQRQIKTKPWEAIQADLSIDLGKHHLPQTFLDKVTYRTVKLLRILTDIFFRVSYTILEVASQQLFRDTVGPVEGKLYMLEFEDIGMHRIFL